MKLKNIYLQLLLVCWPLPNLKTLPCVETLPFPILSDISFRWNKVNPQPIRMWMYHLCLDMILVLLMFDKSAWT